MPKRILFDTDPGIDDACAILLALASPELSLEGLSIVHGNCSLEQATTNALSVLRLLSPAPGAPGLVVSWQSVSGLNYFLERGIDLGTQPHFLPLATNIVGQPGTTTFTDTNAVGPGPFFYRVRVQE